MNRKIMEDHHHHNLEHSGDYQRAANGNVDYMNSYLASFVHTELAMKHPELRYRAEPSIHAIFLRAMKSKNQ